MVFGDRNSRLKQVRRASKHGKQYDQHAVTDSELIQHFTSAIYGAGNEAMELARAFLRAQKVRTDFTIDTDSLGWKQIYGMGLADKIRDLKAPKQRSSYSHGAVQTNLGRLLLDKLASAKYSIGNPVIFTQGEQTYRGILRSIDPENGTVCIGFGHSSQVRLPVHQILTRSLHPIISPTEWARMYSHRDIV
jgi:hypothetical protein